MKRRVAAIILATIAAPALAHPGHGAGGVLAGFTHPFMGADHLLAMLAVGWLALRIGGLATVFLPAAFLAFLAGGAVLGLQGWQPAATEPLLAASVLVCGILMALRHRAATAVVLPLACAFAVFHGMAHAAELPLGATAPAFLCGMVLASGSLHVAGVFLARAAGANRLSGVPVAIAGAAMLMQPVFG